MKVYLMSLAILIALFSFSCTTQMISKKFPYGNYAYTSYNIAGEIVGEGTLFVSRVDTNNIEGNWSIRNIHNCVVCGPQYGGGFFSGSIEGDSLYINLNPDSPQNYVKLTGKINDGNFSGKWRWVELIVRTNWGTFKAVKQ